MNCFHKLTNLFYALVGAEDALPSVTCKTRDTQGVSVSAERSSNNNNGTARVSSLVDKMCSTKICALEGYRDKLNACW